MSMARPFHVSTWLVALISSLAGCEKRQVPDPASSSLPEPTTPQFEIIEQDGRAILADKQIASYEWATHSITLQPGAKLYERASDVRVDSKRSLVQGIPFSVVADGIPCYQGVVTTSLSSFFQSCPVINIHPIDGKEGVVRIELGYPSRKFFEGKDPRGDDRVRKCLQALGKLRE